MARLFYQIWHCPPFLDYDGGSRSDSRANRTLTMPIFSYQLPIRRGRHRVALTGIVCLATSLMAGSLLWAGSPPQRQPGNGPVDAEQGRAIFNGKGLCSTCHGINGYRNRLPPQLSENIRDNIEHLSPAPPDLRQAVALTLTTDKQRFEAIRNGHLRTAMYPLSKEAHKQAGSSPSRHCANVQAKGLGLTIPF